MKTLIRSVIMMVTFITAVAANANTNTDVAKEICESLKNTHVPADTRKLCKDVLRTYEATRSLFSTLPKSKSFKAALNWAKQKTEIQDNISLAGLQCQYIESPYNDDPKEIVCSIFLGFGKYTYCGEQACAEPRLENVYLNFFVEGNSRKGYHFKELSGRPGLGAIITHDQFASYCQFSLCGD